MTNTGVRASWSEAAPVAFAQSPEPADESAREPAEAFSMGQQTQRRNPKSVKVRRPAAATAAMPAAPAVGGTEVPATATAPVQQAQAPAPSPASATSAPFLFGTPGGRLCCFAALKCCRCRCCLHVWHVWHSGTSLATCICFADCCMQGQGRPAAQSKRGAAGAGRLAACRLAARPSQPAAQQAWHGVPFPRPQPVSHAVMLASR